LMRGCCYRDEPLRPGLCLRAFHRWAENADAGGERPRMRRCDKEHEERCPYRHWDHALRLEVLRSRHMAIARCPACGKAHQTMQTHLRCQMNKAIEDAFHEATGWRHEGCSTGLFDPALPSCLLASGRREVRRRVIVRDHNACQDCGRDLACLPSWFTEVHHIMPRIRGGTDHPFNLKTLCVICHRAYTEDLFDELTGEAASQEWNEAAEKFGPGAEVFERLLQDAAKTEERPL
jgi:hypothetical protein